MDLYFHVSVFKDHVHEDQQNVLLWLCHAMFSSDLFSHLWNHYKTNKTSIDFFIYIKNNLYLYYKYINMIAIGNIHHLCTVCKTV